MLNNNHPRVRFAPSPTGNLHIGGLRTALFNYLFAKKNNGKIILRIEDTDQKRKISGTIKSLENILKWSGIVFDEGPNLGGRFGPYLQSQRLEIYKKHVKILLDSKNAYRCFCTTKRLAKMREEQIKKKINPRYDRHCRSLSVDEVNRRLDQEMPFVIRMKINHVRNTFCFKDLIRGEVSISVKQIDDQIILKSDKYPTYHLANVVDDHLMNITHVIRGEEWLSSVPKHIQLYEYFGWKSPQFAHIPLLLNQDRSKLSKRQNDVAVEDYRDKGYNRQGLLNFISLLGWNSKTNQEIFTLIELIELFSLKGVNKAGAIVNIQKLDWISNQHYLKTKSEKLLELADSYFPIEYANWSVNKKQKALNIIISELSYLKQLPKLLKPLNLENSKRVAYKLIQEEDKTILERLITYLNKANKNSFKDKQEIKLYFKNISKDLDIQVSKVYQSIRLALTGEKHGIDVATLIIFHGPSNVIKHIYSLIDQK